MRTLNVALGARAYPIHIGPGLLARGDLLLPLWPAAALLAGREMSLLLERIGRAWSGAVLAGLTFFFLGATWWTYHARTEGKSEEVRYTVAAERAALALAASGLDARSIHHLDTPVTLQLGLGTFNIWIKEQEALRLASGPEPVLLAVETPGQFPRLFSPQGPPLREVFRWPSEASGKPTLQVFRTGEGK